MKNSGCINPEFFTLQVNMKMKGILILLTCYCLSTKAQVYTPSPLNTYLNADSLSSMRALDLNRRSVNVHSADDQYTVYVFLSPECPLCLNYTKTLNELAARFTGSVTFTGIVPGKTYSVKEIRKFINEYKFTINTLRDPDLSVSRFMGATITPEVIVIDKAGAIRYRGAIDDWVISIGKKRERPSKFYLQDALQQLVNNEVVATRSTIPRGCFINDY